MSEADELEKLHHLLAKGALTQAEYERAKGRLLASTPGPGAGLAINRLRRSVAAVQASEQVAAFAGIRGVSPLEPPTDAALSAGNFTPALERAAEAHHYLQDRKNFGKVLLTA